MLKKLRSNFDFWCRIPVLFCTSICGGRLSFNQSMQPFFAAVRSGPARFWRNLGCAGRGLLCSRPGGSCSTLGVLCLGDAYAAPPELEGDGHLGLEHGDHVIILEKLKVLLFGKTIVSVVKLLLLKFPEKLLLRFRLDFLSFLLLLLFFCSWLILFQ